jgi:hypothetical protein
MTSSHITPELLGKIISYLPVENQCSVSRVNRTWRLEARRQLYLKRGHIIDRLVWIKQTLSYAIEFIHALNLNKMDELEACVRRYIIGDRALNKIYVDKYRDKFLYNNKRCKLIKAIRDNNLKIMNLQHYMATHIESRMTEKEKYLAIQRWDAEFIR